jgi:hypothetical protein
MDRDNSVVGAYLARHYGSDRGVLVVLFAISRYRSRVVLHQCLSDGIVIIVHMTLRLRTIDWLEAIGIGAIVAGSILIAILWLVYD